MDSLREDHDLSNLHLVLLNIVTHGIANRDRVIGPNTECSTIAPSSFSSNTAAQLPSTCGRLIDATSVCKDDSALRYKVLTACWQNESEHNDSRIEDASND